MNERIRELAEQSGLRFTQLMSNPMVPVVDGKETDLAKFAELIVKECAGIGSNIVLSQTEDTDMGVFLGIKKHFGVE